MTSVKSVQKYKFIFGQVYLQKNNTCKVFVIAYCSWWIHIDLHCVPQLQAGKAFTESPTVTKYSLKAQSAKSTLKLLGSKVRIGWCPAPFQLVPRRAGTRQLVRLLFRWKTEKSKEEVVSIDLMAYWPNFSKQVDEQVVLLDTGGVVLMVFQSKKTIKK